MELPLQITSKNLDLSESAETAIREAATKLESFASRIMSCRVMVEVPNRRHQTGSLYNVRLDVHVPGKEIVIKRQSQPALAAAVQEAFDVAGRRLQDYVRRQRGDVKVPNAPPRGVVSRLLRWEGYGFLTTADGRELYFDRKSVLNDGFDKLAEGDEVRFAEEMGDKGPQASSVTTG
jgi:cold shock CspA family protein/ribosome-associated translation inhibitor RaiA